MQEVGQDVIVIGAGAAGLAAAMRLSATGRRVLVLEARDRIGGRVHTIEREGMAVELGAEFIHGRAPEIFELVERFGLETVEVDGEMFCNRDGRLCECDFFEEVDKVLEELKKYRGDDKSFEEFLRGVCEAESTREWARGYVAGFQGADPQDASILAIQDDTRAEEKIDGERSWRIVGGYKKLIECMAAECERKGVEIRLGALVRTIEHEKRVSVETDSRVFTARQAIVTLPLGVLQSGAVKFEPELDSKRDALARLAMGEVARCVLLFRSRWWEQLKSSDGKSLRDLSFLFSRLKDFPTWWTQSPRRVPMLTAWASALSAPALRRLSKGEIKERAMHSLEEITGVVTSKFGDEIVSAEWHDWHEDPLSQGAYSYAKVGGRDAYAELARPIGGLFFAGEATETTGNHATVHGAIASGYRAADEVLSAT